MAIYPLTWGACAAAIAALASLHAPAAAPHGITIQLDPPLPYHAPPSRRPRPAWRSPLTREQQAERLVALTIWGEARGYGDSGMRAIASVIMNRARADVSLFGHGTTGVVWHRRRFSCWSSSDPNREAMRTIAKLPHSSPDWIRWVQAKGIAHMAIAGRLKDQTGGATFYHTGSVKPHWDTGMRVTRVAWGHLFFAPKIARA